MSIFPFHFLKSEQPIYRKVSVADFIVLLALVAVLFVGAKIAFSAPTIVKGPVISLSPQVLPWYALFSITRMGLAYLLSVIFTLFYGYIAASSRRGEQFLIPLLDILQSVPILSFLPLVLLSLTAFLPTRLAVEIAAVVLIFTSQVWNLTFAWYQSLKSVPGELREASQIFGFSKWRQFRVLEFPFFAISFIWNSMMSWSGGWFFLMAAETFTVGHKDFRLPGLGSFLKEAAIQHNYSAILWGIGVLIFVIVFLDQLVWQPLLQWSQRFKLDLVEGDSDSGSWALDLISKSHIIQIIHQKFLAPFWEWLDQFSMKVEKQTVVSNRYVWRALGVFGAIIFGVGLTVLIVESLRLLMTISLIEWQSIIFGDIVTFLRVGASLLIALAWTVPIGVLIGTNKKMANFLQPLIQMTASIPATALFPLVLLVFLNLPGGLNIAAIFLMIMGTQWYLLFNVIAGANSIPQDLKYTTALLQLSLWQRWKVLILPSLFPFIITGAITASGGAWNASIVAEYVDFGGRVFKIHGIGYIIADATGKGDYSIVLAATVIMIFTVVSINRLVWRPLYALAQERYKME